MIKTLTLLAVLAVSAVSFNAAPASAASSGGGCQVLTGGIDLKDARDQPSYHNFSVECLNTR